MTDDAHWGPRLALNREVAVLHQWEQLEESGCIDNFRILAGERTDPHRG
jgi:uncharacterized protein